MKENQLGIWMDHASAHLIGLNNGVVETKTILLKSVPGREADTVYKDEKSIHHKEQQETLAYYKKIAAIIVNYEDVLLFGPTEAKAGLFNMLKTDHRFDKIKIEIKQADKMTENQQLAFVKKHFFV